MRKIFHSNNPESTRENPVPCVALIGNPNTGKSTVFNSITGLRQKVANFPGVTVEKHIGRCQLSMGDVQFVDLPGTYAISPNSPDEMIATDVITGQVKDIKAPDVIVVVIDASNLQRNLFLLSQVLELEVPVVVALNMMDVAKEKGVTIDVAALASAINAKVVTLSASKGQGIAELKQAIDEVIQHPVLPTLKIFPEVRQAAIKLAASLNQSNLQLTDYEVERAILDEEGYAEERLIKNAGIESKNKLVTIRQALAPNGELTKLDIRKRYDWVHELLSSVTTTLQPAKSNYLSDRIDRVVSHPVSGTVLFVLVMATVFQAVFAWATPLMDMIDASAHHLGQFVYGYLPEGAMASLLVDGIIAGVGSVLIFLPQILILSAFIILLEDTGYMSRAAFLIDRLMRMCGLSGQSFIPMLSSFACAVPGIMATRVIPDWRDRFTTILSAPFMTCSARLPVYALLIAAFIPREYYFYGLINLQGLVLLGLYLLGIFGGIFTAWLLKHTFLRGPSPTFLMELPPYRLPNLKSVLIRLRDRIKIFIKRAGTVIFSVAVIVWALAYFPQSESIKNEYDLKRSDIQASLTGEELQTNLSMLDNQEASALLNQSLLARMGKSLEPVFKPLGWDWRVSSAVIASFPAREVVIAVLGTIYAVGDDVDETDVGLRSQIQSSTWPDGSPVYTLPMVLGLLIFYAFCLQCVATVSIIYRETNSWRWPIFAWTYMTGLGYIAALATFKIGSLVAA